MSRPLKVLQLIDHMGVGGAQDVVLDIIRESPDESVSYEIAALFTDHANEDEIGQLGVPFHDLGTGARYSPVRAASPRVLLRLRRLLKANKYDVVHVHLFVGLAYLTAFRRWPGRAPVVATVHTHRNSSPAWVFKATTLAARVVSRFCAVLPGVKDDLISSGVDPASVVLVPLGARRVDPTPPPNPVEYRAELGLRDGAFVILSLARLHPQRHLDAFIQALPTLVDRGIDPQLVLAGTGPQEHELRDLAHALDVSDHVQFPGYRRDHAELLWCADAYVSLSLTGKDVGVAALQAGAAGLPVVSWDVDGVRTDFGDLDDAHPSLTADGVPTLAGMLGRLATDATLRKEVGAHCERVATEWGTTSDMATRYCDLFRALTAR